MALIGFKADLETKARFTALARSEGVTQSELLRRVVSAVLANNTGWQAELKSGHRGGVKGKIDVRLAGDEIASVRELAKAESRSAAAWVAALVRSKLKGSVPFNPDELRALKDAAVQLASVGRNLNALVHHFRRSGRVDADSVRVDELHAAMDLVKAEVLELRDRAMRRYGTE